MNLAGIWQAAYTAGVVLPKPVATATYYHRALQPKKLVAVNFTRLAVRPVYCACDVLPPRAAPEEAGRRQVHAPGGALWPGASVKRGLCCKVFAMTLFLWRHTLAGVPEYVWAGSAQLRTRMACIIQTARGADPRILAFSGDGVWQIQTLVADTVCLGPSSRA